MALTRFGTNFFESFFDRMLDDPFSGMALTKRNGNDFGFALDMKSTETDYLVNADLPGVNKDEIDIRLKNGVLTISTERNHEKKEGDKENGKYYYYYERSYGSFSRSVRMPEDVNEEDVEASYENGVLRLRIGRSEQPSERLIKVN